VVNSFNLRSEDAQYMDDWRLRIKGQLLTQVYMENGHYNCVCGV